MPAPEQGATATTQPAALSVNTASVPTATATAHTLPPAVAQIVQDIASVDLLTHKLPHAFLDDQSAQIRSKTIPWDGYANAQLVTQEELKLLTELERYRPSYIKDFMDRSAAPFSAVLVSVLSKVNSIEAVQWLLVLLDDVFPGYQSLFLQQSNIFDVVAKCLTKEDEFTSQKAASLLTTLFASNNFVTSDAVLQALLQWLLNALNATADRNRLVLATQLLQTVLRSEAARHSFASSEKGVSSLISLLKSNDTQLSLPQNQYQVIQSIWQLSFLSSVASTLQTEYQILPIFMDIAKSATKEKLIRMCLATFRNMLQKAREENMSAMIGIKMIAFVDVIASRKYADEEINADVTYLKDELTKVFQTLSSFDEYASEVRGGKLEWSPPHQSELFWKQNAQRLNEKDLELLRILTRLLCSATNPTVLLVACHDIGQYVKYYPAGKKFIQDLGTKHQIMQLMSHENAEVRYHALLAVQKLMVNTWE